MDIFKDLMFKLSEFEVTVHIDINEFSQNIETQINLLSKNYELIRSTEYCGRRDYHWAFNSWSDALLLGEKLKVIANNPNCILIEVHANYDDNIESIFHKNLL